MCDRCSHSRFHAFYLNNSPCTVNPWTLDHLHGTTGPRKFRLLPSVCLCASTTPPCCTGALRVTTQPNKHAFFSLPVLPFSVFFFFFFVKGEASSPKRARWDYPLTRRKWQRPQPQHLAADFFQRDIFSVQASQHPLLVMEHSQQRHHLCRQLQHQAGNAGICRHPSSTPPQPLPVLPPPPGDKAHSAAETARLNSCPPAAACHLMFSQ